MRLDGRVALVTGASSGIGKCIAETYAREGARVALADINADGVKSVARTIGNNAITLRCDVSKKADVDGVVEEPLAAFGVLDILVNNAGATHVNKPVLEISEANYDRIFAVNVKGIFFRLSGGYPRVPEAGRGRHHQYRIDRRIASAARALSLQRHQRRRPRADQVACRRARA